MTIKRYPDCIRLKFLSLDLFLFRRWYKRMPHDKRLVVALPFMLLYRSK